MAMPDAWDSAAGQTHVDLGWVTIPTEEFERLHAENKRLQELVLSQDRHAADAQAEIERLQADNRESTWLREALVQVAELEETIKRLQKSSG